MWSDPFESRPAVRVMTLYEASGRSGATGTDHSPLGEQLRLGQLEPFYQTFARQRPSVLVNEQLDSSQATFRRWRNGPPTEGRLWLFGMPSEQFVVGLEVDVAGDLHDVADLIDDCAHGDVAFGGLGVAELAAHAGGWLAAPGQSDEVGLTRERHQLVVTPTMPADVGPLIEDLVTRTSVTYANEPGSASYPAQLNQRPGAAAAISPHATVLCGQPEYVVNSALAVAAQAVANVARLRGIHAALHRELRQFWAVDRSSNSTRRRRAALETITHKLARLELDLAVAVEAPTDTGELVPSKLVREYQDQLYSALDIPLLVGSASRMLRRLEATGRAELASVANIERRADEDRHQRWAVGVGFVSAVAIPLSLILAFFSAELAELESARSMFGPEYRWLYGAIGILILIAVGIGIATFLAQRKSDE